MKKSAPCLVVAVSLLALSALCDAQAAKDSPARDEFGQVPEDAHDKDLSLPDPVLDRTWPGPKPGDADAHPPRVAADEDRTDPFHDEDAPDPEPAPAPPPSKVVPGMPEEERRPPPLPPPLIGPDGKLDAGSPMPEPDPAPPDVLEPDAMDPSEMEKEEMAPSPLDREQDEYDEEMSDPGDGGDY